MQGVNSANDICAILAFWSKSGHAIKKLTDSETRELLPDSAFKTLVFGITRIIKARAKKVRGQPSLQNPPALRFQLLAHSRRKKHKSTDFEVRDALPDPGPRTLAPEVVQ